jgi:hypothetical protein
VNKGKGEELEESSQFSFAFALRMFCSLLDEKKAPICSTHIVTYQLQLDAEKKYNRHLPRLGKHWFG